MDREAKILEYLNSKKFELAFNLLVDNYQQKLYWHIRRILLDHEDSNDVLQNTFIKIWKGLKNFKSESKIYTWAYRIATNESITFLNKKRNLQNFEEYAESAGQGLHTDPFFDGEEALVKLYSAIATLPDKQKLVFNLKYFDEMKYEDMSDILNTSVGSLKASYHHAVRKIEDFLKED